MNPLDILLIVSTVVIAGCEQPQPTAQTSLGTLPTLQKLPTATESELDGMVIDSLYFGRYLVAHDDESYSTVYYRPYPDSAWTRFAGAGQGLQCELDTANVDRSGAPELLLTEPYKRRGNPDYGEVSVLYILRIGPQIDTLFKALVSCKDYHHSWESGESRELSMIGKTQQITAGYGFVRVGQVRTTCEQHKMHSPCQCDDYDLVEAGNPQFARPGRYRWQQGRLVRSNSQQ